MDTEEQTEGQTEAQEPPTPAPKRRGRPKKAREEEGGGALNAPPAVGALNAPTLGGISQIPPPQPLSTGFWMGLLTTQREMELEAKRDKYKRFSIA